MSDEYGFFYETVFGVPNRVRIDVPTEGTPFEDYQASGLEFEEWLKGDVGGEWVSSHRARCYSRGGFYKAWLRSRGYGSPEDWEDAYLRSTGHGKRDEVETVCQCGGPAGHVIGGMNCRK